MLLFKYALTGKNSRWERRQLSIWAFVQLKGLNLIWGRRSKAHPHPVPAKHRERRRMSRRVKVLTKQPRTGEPAGANPSDQGIIVADCDGKCPFYDASRDCDGSHRGRAMAQFL